MVLAAVGLRGCARTLAAASGGCPLAEVSGFSLRRLLLLQSTGSRRRWHQQWWGTSLVAPRDVGSSRTSDQIHIIGRQTQPPDHQGSPVPNDKGSNFSALPQLFFQAAPLPPSPSRTGTEGRGELAWPHSSEGGLPSPESSCALPGRLLSPPHWASCTGVR